MGTVLKIAAGILLAFVIIIVIVVVIGSAAYNADKERQIKEAEEYTKRSYALNNYSYTECKWSDSQAKIVCSYAVK
jgi:hypothetical protein